MPVIKSVIVAGTLVLVTAGSALAQSVSLGSAETFAVLAADAVTNTGASTINGDVGVFPGSSITGFPPGTLATGASLHAGDAVAAQAQMAATAAYDALAAKTCRPANMLPASFGGMVLTSGVYCFATNAQLTGTLTLSGMGPWIFKVPGTLTVDPAAVVARSTASMGCSGSRVFWQVGGASASIGAGSTLIGSVLAQHDVTVGSAATIDGRVVSLEDTVTTASAAITACTRGQRFPAASAIGVTGGGQIAVPSPDSTDPDATGFGRATFGFNARPASMAGPASGRLVYLNHVTDLAISGPVTHVEVVSVDAAGRPAVVRFGGTCSLSSSCTFVVLAEDHRRHRERGHDDDDHDDDDDVDDDDDGDGGHRGGDGGGHRGPRPNDADRFGIVVVSGGSVVEARSPRAVRSGNIKFHMSMSSCVNRHEFRVGDVISVGVSLLPDAVPSRVDAYLVLQLPGGQLLSWTGAALVPGIVPMARNVVPDWHAGTVLQTVIPPGTPPGTYRWLSAFATPGTLNLVTDIAESSFRIKP